MYYTSHRNNCRAKWRCAYHRARGLYFLAVVFAATIVILPCKHEKYILLKLSLPLIDKSDLVKVERLIII